MRGLHPTSAPAPKRARRSEPGGYQAWCRRIGRRASAWIVPGLRYSQDYYEEALTAALRPGVRWLDLGCGHRILPEWRLSQERALIQGAGQAVGADRDWPAMRRHRSLSLRVGADIRRLPFAAQSFDLVTANMVVEHLDAPDQQFQEVFRVLAPGGRFLFHTPNLFGYYTMISRLIPEPCKRPLARLLESRLAADVYPTFYRANSSAQVRRLAAASRFAPPQLRYIASAPVTMSLPLLLPLELLWIRFTLSKVGAALRTNVLAELHKPAAMGETA